MSDARTTQESLRGRRILLVEDDPLISLDLEASLSDLGAVVTSVFDVTKALEFIAASPPDFAVLDLELGAETAEPIAVAVLSRDAPFLFLSGYSEDDVRFARWPDIRVFVKPISVTALAEYIQETLSARLPKPER